LVITDDPFQRLGKMTWPNSPALDEAAVRCGVGSFISHLENPGSWFR
jgi:hypothetical protein